MDPAVADVLMHVVSKTAKLIFDQMTSDRHPRLTEAHVREWMVEKVDGMVVASAKLAAGILIRHGSHEKCTIDDFGSSVGEILGSTTGTLSGTTRYLFGVDIDFFGMFFTTPTPELERAVESLILPIYEQMRKGTVE